MQTKIKTNVVVNIIKTITLTLFSFLTFPWVCRILGDAQLGIYSWCVSFVYYFLILSRISIPSIAVRECVKVRDDKIKLSTKVQEFFILQAIMTLASFILLFVIAITVPVFRSNDNYLPLIFILSINFLSGVMSFEWVFEALERHVYLALRQIVVSAIIDIMIFVFVKYPQHIEIYALINVSLTVITVICNLCYLPKFVSFKKSEPYNFKQYLPTLLTLFIISLVVALYDKTDTFILGLIDDTKAAVGSYAVGIKAIEIIIGIVTALGTVFMPRAVSYYQNNQDKFVNLAKYSTNIALIIVVPAIAMLVGLATPITSLISGNYAGGYDSANYVLMALSSMMLTFSLSRIIYTQILIPMKKEKYYMISIAVGFVLNVALSLVFGLLIFKNSPAVGVAIATSLVDVLILLILGSLTWKQFKVMFLNINTLKIIIIGIIIGLITYFVSPLLIKGIQTKTNNIEITYVLTLVTMLFGDALLYLVGLLLLKEKLVKSILKK